MHFVIDNSRVTVSFPYSDTGPTRDDELLLAKAIKDARHQAAERKTQ